MTKENIEGQEEHSQILNEELNTQITMTTMEMKSIVDFSMGNISFEDLLYRSKSGFQKYLIEYVKENKPLTNGQEADIFRIKGKHGDYLIAKKRYDCELKEAAFHEEIYQLAMNNSTSVKVPKLLHKFKTDLNGYIVMEYIDGKTLQTMIFEKIINQIILKRLKTNDSDDIKQKYSRLEDCRFDGTNLEFFNDTIVRDCYLEIMKLLENRGIINEEVTQVQEGIEYVRPEYFKKYKGLIKLFTEDEKSKLEDDILDFIEILHNNGISHNDIGDNLRNIMLSKSQDGYQAYIIDFGKSGSNTEHSTDKNLIDHIYSLQDE